MTGFAFRKNATFEWNGAPFRVREITPNGELLLEALNSGELSLVQRQVLLAEYAAGTLRATSALGHDPSEPLVYSRPLSELKPHVQAEVKRRYHYLSVICSDGQPVWAAHFLDPLIEKAALDLEDPDPPSVSTLNRWFLKYEKAKRDNRALVPRFDRRGRTSPQPARLLNLLAACAQDAFKLSPRASVRMIHDRLRKEVEDWNRTAAPSERLTVPNIRTTYRLLQRAEVYELVCLREGKSAADKRLRVVKQGPKSERVLERVEIDHTPLDLFLIDDETGLPMGRPTLTVGIDHYSRMPCGYFLSFGDPSAAAVVGLLRHMILPKTLDASTLPSLPIEGTWPVYGVPEAIVADNGLEFHGVDLASIAFDLGIVIQYCGKRQPWCKGAIERYLKTINYFFAHQMPGTSMAKLHERGDYDPQRHAVLTFRQFKQILEKWFVDVYANEVHRGIQTTPLKRWTEGALAHTPVLPADVRQLAVRMGRSAERSLRRTGVELNGIRYNGDGLLPILRKFGEGVTVRVVFDPEDLGEIQVWGPDDETPIAVRALDYGYAKGLTQRQNELIRDKTRQDGESARDEAAVWRSRVQIAEEVEQLMKSPKVRERRRSGAVRGISSSLPEGSPALRQPPPKKRPDSAPKPASQGSGTTAGDEPPQIFTPFQMKRRSGGTR